MATLLTTTQARANLYRLIDEGAMSHTPIIITGKQNNAVLVSQSDWDAMQETLYLMSVPGMRESIKKGLQTAIADCSEIVEW